MKLFATVIFLCLVLGAVILNRQSPPRNPAQLVAYDPKFEQKMRFKAGVFLKALKDQGVEKIGDVQISKLAEDVQSVNWRHSPAVYFTGSESRRSSSIYIEKEKVVVFNSNHNYSIRDAHMPMLAIHESLGALGYPDEDYELSFSLYLRTEDVLKSTTIDPKILDEKFKNLKKKKKELLKDRGGSTSVAGGGDLDAMRFKFVALILLKSWHQKNKEKVDLQSCFDKLISLRIETSETATKVQRIKYDGIEIPRDQWRMLHEEYSDAMINFVTETLDMVFLKND